MSISDVGCKRSQYYRERSLEDLQSDLPIKKQELSELLANQKEVKHDMDNLCWYAWYKRASLREKKDMIDDCIKNCQLDIKAISWYIKQKTEVS